VEDLGVGGAIGPGLESGADPIGLFRVRDQVVGDVRGAVAAGADLDGLFAVTERGRNI